MHSWNEQASMDIHDYEVIDFHGSENIFQKRNSIPKVNPWTYPQPKPFFLSLKKGWSKKTKPSISMGRQNPWYGEVIRWYLRSKQWK